MKSATKDLTSGNLYRNFLLFAIPLVLSSVMSQALSMVDMIIAGRFIGDAALAATGAASSFHSLFNAPLWGFFTGMGVYIAHLFGAERYKELKSTVFSVFLLICGVILLLSAVTILCREPLFRFLKVDEKIWDDAMLYFLIVMCGKVLTLGSGCGIYTLNAMGNTVFPFWMSLTSSLLNLFGNIFTVTVLNWGVFGIACSTVFSSLVVFVAYIVAICRCLSQLTAGEKEPFRFDLSAVRHALRYSAPTSIQQLAMYICTFALAPLVNGIGMLATAGYSVVQKAYDVCFSFFTSSSRTVGNYVAQCAGAGKLGKIPKGMAVGFLQGTVFMIVPLLLFILFPSEICGLFFNAGYEGEPLVYAVRFCRYFLPFILFSMINNQFHAFYRGFGVVRMLIFSSALGAVSRLILSYLLVGKMEMDGIFLAWVLSWVIEMLFSLTVYLTRYRNADLLQKRQLCL